MHDITRSTMEDPLLNQAPPQRVLLVWRSYLCMPALWQLWPHGGKGLSQLGSRGTGHYRCLLMLYVGVVSVFERTQGGFPTFFQLGGDQAVIGIDTAELSLRQDCLVAQPLQSCVCA